MCFSKNTFGLFGVHKQVERAHFEPIASHFANPKSLNAWKTGCFAYKNESTMDQKRVFPKMLVDYLGCADEYSSC